MDCDTSACRVRVDGDMLVAGNKLFERRWRVRNGLLYAISCRDLGSGREWLAKESVSPAPLPPVGEVPDEPRDLALECRVMRPSPVGAEALEATLTAEGRELTLEYRFIVFPAASGVAMQLAVRGPAAATLSVPEAQPVTEIPTGDEKTLTGQGAALPPADGLEHLNLAPPHLRLTRVAFADITDNHNELATERNWLLHPSEVAIAASGNLFFIEDVLNGDGLIMLKEAPLPDSRPVKTWADLRVHGKACFSSSIKAAEFKPGHPRWPLAYQIGLFGHGMEASFPEGYRWVVLAYRGGRPGRVKVLQDYQRQWRRYEAGRDGLLLSNTWGDRSMNSRVNEPFILKETAAAARLGADIMEIDDGWQRGLDGAPPSGSSDLWQGIWKATDRYWTPHPKRLPGGLGPVVECCSRNGVKLGLWYVVDPNDHYASWQRDLDHLMTLHREHGVCYFKFDGGSISSRRGEQNFRKLINELLVRSGGRIVVDLDITAGVRQGYWGLMEQGPLFVENRYTDWHGYWPHQSLRNLWTLAQYIDPVRMRFEFLNNTRNEAFYAGDPLAPALYSGDYLFATAMFSSPQAFLEVQNLPPSVLRQAAKLIAVWKQHRAEIFAGSILPVGEQPDGASWTGFSSCAEDGKSAYVLAFREHTDRDSYSFKLSLSPEREWQVARLSGRGRARYRAGALTVTLPAPLSYVFVKLTLC